MSWRSRTRGGLLLATVVLAVAAPLSAHELKESLTRVLFNERTGNIEVMHRFLLHDAEHAVQKLFGSDADLLENAQDRERFEGYVHQRFSLVDHRGDRIKLVPVGNEIEGSYLWVYAEALIPAELDELTLAHSALQDVWPEQVNRVNVERDKLIRSAAFTQETREATLEF